MVSWLQIGLEAGGYDGSYVAMLGRCNDVLGMLYLGGTYDLLRCVLKNTAG